MGLELLSPWLLAGLGALAVPLLVHLARRPARRGRPFPSLMLVRQVRFPARSRRGLRDPWLLLLRALALAALVLGFSGPRCSRMPSAPEPPARDVVFLLDRSYSMSVPARWRSALRALDARLGRLEAGARAALVMFDERPQVWFPLGSDLSELRRRLHGVVPGALGTDLETAVVLGERTLDEGGAAQRTLVVVSDLQRTALGETAVLELDPATRLEMLPVGDPVGPNPAIVEVRPAPADRDRSGVQSPELAVVVRNTGDAPAPDVEVTVDAQGRIARAPPFTLAPGEERTTRVAVPLAHDGAAGATVGLATAGTDAIAADDRYHLVLTSPRPLRVVNVAPAGSAEALFVREALAAGLGPDLELRGVDPLGLDARALTDAEAVIWAAPVPPASAQLEALESYVGAGGGLLLLSGEPARAGPAAPGWLPRSTPGAARNGGLRLDPFGDAGADVGPGRLEDALAALADLVVFRYRRLLPEEADRVLGRLEGGDPLFVERRHGAGRVLVAATGVSADLSTLAVEPGFAPLLTRVVRHLAGRAAPVPAYGVGDVVDLARLAAAQRPGGSRGSPSEARGVVVKPPVGAPYRLASQPAVLRVVVPGLYEVLEGGGAPPLWVAVNTAREESLLTAYRPEEVRGRVTLRPAGGAAPVRTERSTAPANAAPAGAAWYIVAGAALLFLAEGVGAAGLSRRTGLLAPAARRSRAGTRGSYDV